MRESLGVTKPKGEVKVKVWLVRTEVRSCRASCAVSPSIERQAHHRPVPWCDDPIQSLSSGRSMSVHFETRKMVNYASAG